MNLVAPLLKRPCAAFNVTQRTLQVAFFGLVLNLLARADNSVYLTETPDYHWYAGCFGTATGNLIGFWDRHGFPKFYTGPTNKGVAPTTSAGNNSGITALWASEAGVDGRPFNQPGHMEDYYIDYESPSEDPYVLAKRREHTPDCIGDFIGLSQNKWKDLGDECDGNLDAYSFVFWEKNGNRRSNYTAHDTAGNPIPDIQSGLREWAKHCGYEASSFTQLADFNPTIQTGRGFSFEDLKAEIDAGYPVLLFMQDSRKLDRTVHSRTHVNPSMHGMLAYGYIVADDGSRFVRYRTSWASGDYEFSLWNADEWTPEGSLHLPLRGVIGFHPAPKITSITPTADGLELRWDAPRSFVYNETENQNRQAQAYVIESSTTLSPPQFEAVGSPVTTLNAVIPIQSQGSTFYRVKVIAN